ncbi:hypothetical protein EYF80_033935 [Liparis tanakae]|uniref:Uncharacterized protein n=1 Tax=Liparis tanakae TaxID=230148 RepID=A0A4Z2GQL0_9TELE|nr:hypothetical protein EYF80_033935 [Liparis tanakae]
MFTTKARVNPGVGSEGLVFVFGCPPRRDKYRVDTAARVSFDVSPDEEQSADTSGHGLLQPRAGYPLENSFSEHHFKDRSPLLPYSLSPLPCYKHENLRN